MPEFSADSIIVDKEGEQVSTLLLVGKVYPGIKHESLIKFDDEV